MITRHTSQTLRRHKTRLTNRMRTVGTQAMWHVIHMSAFIIPTPRLGSMTTRAVRVHADKHALKSRSHALMPSMRAYEKCLIWQSDLPGDTPTAGLERRQRLRVMIDVRSFTAAARTSQRSKVCACGDAMSLDGRQSAPRSASGCVADAI